MCFDDEWEREYEARRELKRQKFFKLVYDSIREGDLICEGMALIVCRRFRIDFHSYIPDVVYMIVDYYLDNDIEEDFHKWLNKDDAPLIRKERELSRIFPEIALLTDSNHKIVELANQIYDLDLKLDGGKFGDGYIYSFSFDFNSFTPIDLEEVRKLKQEIRFCRKYGIDHKELDDKLKEFNLSSKILKEV